MSPNDYDEVELPPPPPRGRRRTTEKRRLRGPGRWVLVGIALAVLIGIGVVSSISQTAWGRDQVLAYTLRTIGGRLNGELTVQRLDGNLIGGARMYDISLVGPEGEPLFAADSAYIQYRLATFLGGDVVINRLSAFNANVNIYRMPGDTLWNYQVILEDPTPNPEAEAKATLIERLFLFETRIEVTVPVEGDPRFNDERRQRELQEMLADTARYMIEEVPGGYVQTTLVDVEAAELSELYIGGEQRGGTYLQMVDAVANVRLWRDPPLEVRGVTGQLHLDQRLLSFEASRLVLPNSEGSAVGEVDLTGERPLYDLFINAPDFALSDLGWLYPWLPSDPEAGEGSVRLWVEDREEGLLVIARDLDLRMPQTHVTGDFGLISDAVTERLRFVDVDLEADPLRIESVEQLLPADIPIDGLVIGGASIRGES